MIPVVVNNRDLLPEQIVLDLLSMDGVCEVHLIDNASTYPMLLYWLDAVQQSDKAPVFVHRWQNCGPRAACRLVHQMRPQWTARGITHYATTDSDLDLTGIPGNAIKLFADTLEAGCPSPGLEKLIKVGCALRIDDLPDTPVGRLAREAEAKHWRQCTRINWESFASNCNFLPYLADIDTTLAVYRLNPPWDGSYGPSVRFAGAYQARHLPWYHTDENRPADYRHYLKHADPAGTFYTAAEKHKCNQ